jgi:N6-adenosine-specific RNA methylase IME4
MAVTTRGFVVAKQLIHWADQRQQIADILDIDELKNIRNQATAMQDFAVRAKDRELAAHAAEYRARSERRLGELMAVTPKAEGARAPGTARGKATRGTENPASYLSQGIDKNLAKSARAAWAMDEQEFEVHVTKIRNVAQALADSLKDAIAVARAEEMAKKAAKKKERHKKIATESKFAAQTAVRSEQYALIYADPPWTFETFSEKGEDRSPSNHYPTMNDDLIANVEVEGLRVGQLAARDSVCFLWCTSANLLRAIGTLGAWGFAYRTHCVWDKVVPGTGYIFRNQHEVLLFGAKGNPPAPVVVPSSVITKQKTAHSEKPAEVRALIESMYPHFNEDSRIELFYRGDPIEGWSVWGLEARAAA